MRPRSPLHTAYTRLMSLAMLLVGIALLVRTLVAGGGIAATGLILGVLFVLAGAGRLYLQYRAGSPPNR